MESKHLPPRNRGEMVEDLGIWLIQGDLVVLPRDLADDLLRCAMNGTEANPDWRTESISIGKRCLELRQQRDDMGTALVSERVAHEKTKLALANAKQILRKVAAEKEDSDGRSNESNQGA